MRTAFTASGRRKWHGTDAFDLSAKPVQNTACVAGVLFLYCALWQIRINAAARAAGLTYSRFMEGLKAAKVALDRKVLADLAAQDNAAFSELVKVARDALKTKAVAKA